MQQCGAPPDPAPAVQSAPQRVWDGDGTTAWQLVVAGTRLRLQLTRHDDGGIDGVAVSDDGTPAAVDSVTWDDATGRLRLRLLGDDEWRWIDARSVDGVLVGRASLSYDDGDAPADATDFADHVTGWNEQSFAGDIVPRTFFLGIGSLHARLRIDRDGNGVLQARYKQIASDDNGDLDEQPEVDADEVLWDGRALAVRFHDAAGTAWALDATVDAEALAGTLAGGSDGPTDVIGARGELLSAGFGPRDAATRAAWQARTRRQLMHLMMADNPPPTSVIEERSAVAPIASPGWARGRDDNPTQHPADYALDELRLYYALANPHGGAPLSRVIHGFVATPRTPAPPCGRPVVIALNGHDGSAAATFDPASPYWYADGWARRGYLVVAIDVGHRPIGDRSDLYAFYEDGDDPDHGNGVHPAIKAYGFDSDWEEEGERVWDVERAIDYAGTIPDSNPSRVIVTGLSMGGEVTTWAAALDPRVAEAIPAGFDPDQSVLPWHGNHGCWQWASASVTDYVDTADLHALIAPRALVLEAGVLDNFFSALTPPFIDGKELTRRSRDAFAELPQRFVFYLHDDGHAYHFGDVLAANMKAPPLGLLQPLLLAPAQPGDTSWSADASRASLGRTLAQQIHAAYRQPVAPPPEDGTQKWTMPSSIPIDSTSP